jgi:hypothetical protein
MFFGLLVHASPVLALVKLVLPASASPSMPPKDASFRVHGPRPRHANSNALGVAVDCGER